MPQTKTGPYLSSILRSASVGLCAGAAKGAAAETTGCICRRLKSAGTAAAAAAAVGVHAAHASSASLGTIVRLRSGWCCRDNGRERRLYGAFNGHQQCHQCNAQQPECHQPCSSSVSSEDPGNIAGWYGGFHTSALTADICCVTVVVPSSLSRPTVLSVLLMCCRSGQRSIQHGDTWPGSQQH